MRRKKSRLYVGNWLKLLNVIKLRLTLFIKIRTSLY